jgi:hypothetical protein
MSRNGSSPLRAALDRTMAEQGCTMDALTVLDKKNDPFRVDTPAGHRDGGFATTAAEMGLGDRPIHLRGLHYRLIGRPKPDGMTYQNEAKDWDWLGDCAKAARWLGYIPFDQIFDQRNAAPVIRKFEAPDPYAYLSTQIRVDIPRDITPTLCTDDFRGVQPYKLVLIGEKSSLEPVLGPVARFYEADLYLPTGEMSDTMAYRMAAIAAEDGRPMAVLYFSDCDPSGWQMPVSVARKLQAFAELLGGFDFAVYRVALTPDQVGELGLPSTPLKATEKRAGKWQQAMGVEQTEIDALAGDRPELLDQIAREAAGHFFDSTLAGRVEQYRREWLAQASDLITATFDLDRLDEIRRQAEQKLAEMRAQINDLNSQLRVDVDSDDLPVIEIPDADLDGEGGLPPLISSWWDFAEQCRALIDSKAYRDGGTA